MNFTSYHSIIISLSGLVSLTMFSSGVMNEAQTIILMFVIYLGLYNVLISWNFYERLKKELPK